MLARPGSYTWRDGHYLQMDRLRTYRFGGYPVRGQVPLLAYELRTLANDPASRLATMTGFQLHILCSVIKRFCYHSFDCDDSCRHQRRQALRLTNVVATRCPEPPPRPAPGWVEAPMCQSRPTGVAWRPDEASGRHSKLWSSSAEPPYGSPLTALWLRERRSSGLRSIKKERPFSPNGLSTHRPLG